MANVCEVCAQQATLTCSCRNIKLCKKHMDRHLQEPGNHKAEKIEVGSTRKSVSFNASDAPKKSEKQKPKPVSELELKKRGIHDALGSEKFKLQKFKIDMEHCLETQKETLINQIVSDSKTLCKDLVTEFEGKKAMLLEALEELQKPGPVPLTNSIITKLQEIEGTEEKLIECNYNLKPKEFELSEITHIDIQWSSNPVIDEIKSYFEENKAQIPEPLKEFYQKIMKEKHYTLKKMKLTKAHIGKAGVPHLAKILPLVPQIEVLKLGDNEIGSEGAEVLGEALCNCKKLKTLELSDNDLRGKGMQNLAEAFACFTDLEKLTLDKNNLGATGARSLSLCLRKVSRLKELDLDNNGLGAEGLRQLEQVFSKLSHLKTLSLRSNNFGNDSAKHSKSLTHLKKLKVLKLENNNFASEEKRKIEAFVQGCKVTF